MTSAPVSRATAITSSISQVGERQALVGHEHLERGVAVLDQRRQLLAEHLLGRVGDDEVERDVDVAAARRPWRDRRSPPRAGTAPFCCRQNGSTMVLPPNAAERVPVSKSSAMTMPGPEGWARCTWLSMPPGSTSLPRGVDDLARFAEILRRAPRSCRSLMPTSQAKVSDAVATVPPRIKQSNSRIR